MVAWQPLSIVCIQPLIKTIIFKQTPHLLEKIHITTFHVFYVWTKSQFNWSYHASIITIGELPKDYIELQGKVIAQRCVYLVMVHKIFQELVVSIDQIGIHIVPIGGAKTWETKGYQHVKIHGMEGHHQVTMVVSSFANGQCLPFQVIFQGNTSCNLLPLNYGHKLCSYTF